MSSRPSIPKSIEKALFQEAGSRCPVCGQDEVSTLVIHHIVPYSEKPRHEPAQMIVLCSNCHAQADRGEISREFLYNLKQRFQENPVAPTRASPASQTVIGKGNLVAGRDLQVGHLHIHSSKKSRGKGTVIPGTVATDPSKVGYLKYLARRFNEFKEWEVGKKSMKYALIYQAYQREIRYSIEQTPLGLFEQACRYLQDRVKNTKLGRIRSKQGQGVYSTFEEFIRGERGTSEREIRT